MRTMWFGAVLLLPSFCLAGADPGPEPDAASLWSEGEKLCRSGDSISCLAKLQAAFALSPSAEWQSELAGWRQKARQTRDQAQRLWTQAAAMQDMDSYGAQSIYQKALRLWPDPLLLWHIEELKSWEAKRINGVHIADAHPCWLLGVPEAPVPADLSMSHSPGADRSEVRSRTTRSLLPDGRL